METSSSVAPSAELEVPGEPGVYWCAKHRKVKTRLRCGRCERPICVKCTIMGPTGARCPDCASNRTSHIYQVSPVQFAATFAAMVVLSALASAVVTSGFGFLALFYAPVVGTLLSKVVIYVTRGKRGIPLAIVASLGAAVGALAPSAVLSLMVLVGASQTYSPTMTTPGAPPMPGGAAVPLLLALSTFANPWLWLYLILVIPALWYWIK